MLYTGDHMEADPKNGTLDASSDCCWYDWEEQTRSLEKLIVRMKGS